MRLDDDVADQLRVAVLGAHGHAVEGAAEAAARTRPRRRSCRRSCRQGGPTVGAAHHPWNVPPPGEGAARELGQGVIRCRVTGPCRARHSRRRRRGRRPAPVRAPGVERQDRAVRNAHTAPKAFTRPGRDGASSSPTASTSSMSPSRGWPVGQRSIRSPIMNPPARCSRPVRPMIRPIAGRTRSGGRIPMPPNRWTSNSIPATIPTLPETRASRRRNGPRRAHAMLNTPLTTQ